MIINLIDDLYIDVSKISYLNKINDGIELVIDGVNKKLYYTLQPNRDAVYRTIKDAIFKAMEEL